MTILRSKREEPIASAPGLPGLIAARAARHMSRAAVDSRLGLPEERVERWEAGLATPNPWVTLAVAEVVGVGVAHLRQARCTQ